MSDNKTVSGKVSNVQASGSYVGKTGRNQGKTVYKFDIELESGARGQLSCLTEELNGTDAPVAIGETHEFNVYEGKSGYPDSWYLRKAKSEGGWKGGASKGWVPDAERETRKERWAKQLVISRQSALNTASGLISAGCGPSTVENLKDIADQLEKWAYRGLDLKALVAGPPAPKVEAPAPPPTPTPAPPRTKPEAQPALADMPEDDLPF